MNGIGNGGGGADAVHDVFVYGTLMPGMVNAHAAGAAGLLGWRPAAVDGVTLYHLEPEGYPALVVAAPAGGPRRTEGVEPDAVAGSAADPAAPAISPGHADRHGAGRATLGTLVYGAVLRVRRLAPLDRLEGVDMAPPLYLRRRWPLADGGEVWIYLYARPERLRRSGATVIPSGRWRPSASTRPDDG